MSDGVVQATSPSFHGACHFSFLRKTANEIPTLKAAKLLVENFAANNGLRLTSEYFAEEGKSVALLFACFAPENPASQRPKHWHVCCVLWTNAAVRVSVCHDDDTAKVTELASGIFRSVERA